MFLYKFYKYIIPTQGMKNPLTLLPWPVVFSAGQMEILILTNHLLGRTIRDVGHFRA